VGVSIAAYAVITQARPAGVSFGLHGIIGEIVSFAVFLGLGYYIYLMATRKRVEN
jgi:hypothetical protein